MVRRIFHLYLKGYSVDMIIKELVTESITCPTGKYSLQFKGEYMKQGLIIFMVIANLN